MILISIFTSAITSGYSFLENVSKTKRDYQIWLIVIVITAVIISPIGFSKLVEILYPTFGALGIIQILFMLQFRNVP